MTDTKAADEAGINIGLHLVLDVQGEVASIINKYDWDVCGLSTDNVVSLIEVKAYLLNAVKKLQRIADREALR